MAEAGRKRGLGLLAYGCLGCLGAVVLVVIIGGLLSWMAIQEANKALEDEVFTRSLPASGSVTEGLSPSALASDMPDATGLAPAAIAGLVSLQLSGADFYIEPGRPGEPARVEASYNPSAYDLTERFEQAEDGTWSYTVLFEPSGGGSFLTKIGELFSGKTPHVTVYLPAEAFFELDLDIARGGAEIDLGGLWLASADLDFSMGGCFLKISEPLRAPVDRMSINASMGGGVFRNLGNASPRELSIDYRMGGMEVDLEGEWKQDSTITLNHSMGGGSIRLPAGVNLTGLGAAGKDRSGEDGPLLTFDVKSDMGELSFRN